MRLIENPLSGPLASVLAKTPGQGFRLYWLGQAGFVVEGGGKRVVIDPYLSDSLAEKYRGKHFAHIRMMPPPVTADEIPHVDAVLATHSHTDHLDPGTLPALFAANPQAMLIAPKSARAVAIERAQIEENRAIGIDAGETVALPGLIVTATRAAHERLERDDDGFYRFLGLAIRLGGVSVFHSGDTIPFDGQCEEVRRLKADLALFPVNGRDAARSANGVPGNMDMAEALSLAGEARIPAMIAHHFDLFDFNTAPRDEIEALALASETPQALAARTRCAYTLE